MFGLIITINIDYFPKQH